MSNLTNVIPSGYQRRFLALSILIAMLAAAVFGGARWQEGLPVAEAAPLSSPNAQIDSPRGFIQFTVDGEPVEGDVTAQGYEEWSQLYSFSQSMTRPRDGGAAQANPMTVTKAVDRSSPLLMQALLRNSVVGADIKILKPTGGGNDEEALTYQLGAGRVAGHRINVVPGDAELETETISLVFDSLLMTFGDVQVEYEPEQ